MLNLIKKSKKLIIKSALKLKVFLVLFSLFFSSLALAEPTFIANLDIRSKESSPTGITFKPDGTKMFITGINMDKILQYNLTTAFDITSAALEKSVDISGAETKAQDVKFNSDGTVIFLLGKTGAGIDRWSLSTPYDISTIIDILNPTETSIGGDPRGFAFNNDGTKMFVLDGSAEKRVEEYNLSTPYNPDTKTLTNTLANATSSNFHQGLSFNADGSKMFVVKGRDSSDNDDNKIDEYALSTAFDISSSSATLTGTFSPTISSAADISGLAFNNAGTKMYHLDFIGDKVYEYSLSCPFKVTSSSTCDAPQKNKDVRGVVDAQINTAKNFAKDSSQSALKRLSILRANKYYNASAQNIELNFQNELLKKVSNNVLSSAQAKLNPLQKLDQILPNDWEVWSEGSISFGKIGESSLSSAQDIDSLGITVGVDTKMDDDKILGVALRVGSTDVDVGTFGSKVDTNALSLSLYGINSLENSNFLKHVFGVSYLDSDIVRKYEGNTDINTGDREGKQVFGSLNFGREYENSDLIITPTGRIDGSYTALNGYTESGSAAALGYNDQDIKSLMASLGVLIDQDVDLENSIVRSRINLEYGKEFASSSKVVTSYVSNSESFEYQADNKNRDIYTAGLGFDFKHDQGLTISTDYERQQIKGHGYINKFTLSAGFLYRKETEFALGLDEDMTSNFKISKALGVFDLEFDLENNFSNQENHNANLSLLSKF
ncbi:autotransporter domain-containing protein [Candidatus Pelagibacter giovannonii]|uniref:Autotransporter domain-containing protein n=1 Tax=Candidatus Pelagibacter giovannonii TaxID=2563896 RepID=A0A6H1Q3V1_9PROT|nr:autotransporter domain-containing protein [Candidatus Pelagibacter giovannonii]QIZ21356.1 autotransporter domain-containing protein [Candidatus Pelagibacter giovannonii]